MVRRHAAAIPKCGLVRYSNPNAGQWSGYYASRRGDCESGRARLAAGADNVSGNFIPASRETVDGLRRRGSTAAAINH